MCGSVGKESREEALRDIFSLASKMCFKLLGGLMSASQTVQTPPVHKGKTEGEACVNLAKRGEAACPPVFFQVNAKLDLHIPAMSLSMPGAPNAGLFKQGYQRYRKMPTAPHNCASKRSCSCRLLI